MERSPLETIVDPKSIVFLGASNSIESIGSSQLLNIVRGGYTGKVFPIHKREKTVLGVQAYPTIDSIPEPADLAVVAVPKKEILGVFEECGKRGIRHAIVVTAGYGETGKDGEDSERHLTEAGRRWGIRFIGPNCIGIVNAHKDLNTTWFPAKNRPGNVGIISQSGSYITQMFGYFSKLGLGISKAVSVGNQANIDIADCLEYLGNDSDTRSIALYVEGIKRPRVFLEIAKRITPKKPIVALYTGGSETGGRAGSSHTGSISGANEIYNGLFKQTGILRAQSISELYDWSLALAQQPLPPNNNMALLTNSGGPAISMADKCYQLGLGVPVFDQKTQEAISKMTLEIAAVGNPVDIVDWNYDLLFVKLPALMLNLPYIGGLMLYGIFGPVHSRDKNRLLGDLMNIPTDGLEKWLRKACGEFVEIPKALQKPVICSSFTGREDEAIELIQDSNIPVYPSPERAAKAMGALWEYSKIKKSFSGEGYPGGYNA